MKSNKKLIFFLSFSLFRGLSAKKRTIYFLYIGITINFAKLNL